MNVLQYLIQQNPRASVKKAYRKAAFKGHLEVVQRIVAKYTFRDDTLDAREIASMGQYHIIRWFIEQYEWRRSDCKKTIVARGSHGGGQHQQHGDTTVSL